VSTRAETATGCGQSDALPRLRIIRKNDEEGKSNSRHARYSSTIIRRAIADQPEITRRGCEIFAKRVIALETRKWTERARRLLLKSDSNGFIRSEIKIILEKVQMRESS
jgi:hypothetical protein